MCKSIQNIKYCQVQAERCTEEFLKIFCPKLDTWYLWKLNFETNKAEFLPGFITIVIGNFLPTLFFALITQFAKREHLHQTDLFHQHGEQQIVWFQSLRGQFWYTFRILSCRQHQQQVHRSHL